MKTIKCILLKLTLKVLSKEIELEFVAGTVHKLEISAVLDLCRSAKVKITASLELIR